MSDVNWGPQDATMTKTSMQLPLFAYRSMSAFYIEVLQIHAYVHFLFVQISLFYWNNTQINNIHNNFSPSHYWHMLRIKDILGTNMLIDSLKNSCLHSSFSYHNRPPTVFLWSWNKHQNTSIRKSSDKL